MSYRFRRIKSNEAEIDGWVVPKLLPDEFILGWLRRFAVANCIDDTWAFVKYLRHDQRRSATGTDPICLTSFLISEYAGVSISELERLHTLAPWFRFCGSKSTTEERNANAANRSAIRTKGHRSGLCSNCTAEDLASLGWTYWRLSHQIPGVTRCLQHDLNLHFTPSLCFTFHSPLSALSMAKPFPDDSHYGMRYSEIAVGMTEEAFPRIQHQLGDRLHALLEVRSGESDLKLVRKFLAASASLKIPDAWAHHVFVGKINKEQLIESLCLQYPKHLSPINLAILLTLLFDDADRALMFVANQNQHTALGEASKTQIGMRQGF